MEWFAISSTMTTSLEWAGANARARGAWVSLADVCRQTMTEGRICNARKQISRVCRLARVCVGDLRAALEAELLTYDNDDLVLTGWDVAKERETTRAALRAKDHRQRLMKRYEEAKDGLSKDDQGDSDGGSDGGSGGDDNSDASATPALTSVPADVRPTHTDLPPVIPESVRSDVRVGVCAPYAYAPPHADPYSRGDKTRQDKTKEEKIREETASSPPPEVTGAHAQEPDNPTTTASLMNNVPESVRPSFAYGGPYATSRLHLDAHSTSTGKTYPLKRTQEKERLPEKSASTLMGLAPRRSEAEKMALCVEAACADDVLGIVRVLGGTMRGRDGIDYAPEWQRETKDCDARTLLAIWLTANEPIRLPSGLQREWKIWRELPLTVRKDIVADTCKKYKIPLGQRPPEDDASPATPIQNHSQGPPDPRGSS